MDDDTFWHTLEIPPSVKLSHLLARVSDPEHDIVDLSTPDPAHKPSPFIVEEFKKYAGSLGQSSGTGGMKKLRGTISDWLRWRFDLPSTGLSENNVICTNGEAEAVYSVIRVLAADAKEGLIVVPNPADPIYETAGILAGLTPKHVTTMGAQQPNYKDFPQELWEKVKIVVVNTPADPYGAQLAAAQWAFLLNAQEEFKFAIISDERLSEVYRSDRPEGLLHIAHKADNPEYKGCVVINSLSMRSNLVGMRSGFIAGDAEIIKNLNIYRHYHGLYIPMPNQMAAIAAWSDEEHVKENNKIYWGKFKDAPKRCGSTISANDPLFGPYLWVKVPGDDIGFAVQIYGRTGIKVMPGQLLARKLPEMKSNPATGSIRISLVQNPGMCSNGLLEICKFINPKHRSKVIQKS